MWPALFAEAGDPAALQAAALTRGRLRVAACYLVVVDALLGAERGAEAGAALLRAALDARRYDVVGELARASPGRKAARDGTARRRGRAFPDPGSAEPDGERRVGGGFFSFGEGGFLRWIIPSGEASARSVPRRRRRGRGRERGRRRGRGRGRGRARTARRLGAGRGSRRFRRRSSGARRARAAPRRGRGAGALAALASETSFDAAAFLKRERMGLLVRKAAAGRASRTSPSSLGFFDDFPRAARLVAESLRRYRPSVAGAAASASAWGGAGALLRACADARAGRLGARPRHASRSGRRAGGGVFARAGGGGEEAAARILAAWNRAAATCAAGFADAGDARERRARRRIQEARRGRGEDQERSDAEARGEGGEVRRGVRGEARAREARGEVRRGRERREARRGEARLGERAGARRVARVF